MATTKKRKTRSRTRAATAKRTTKRTTKTRTKRQAATAEPIELTITDKATALEVKDERLVVKLSRDSHPEVFEVDQLLKQVQKVQESTKGRRKLRDLHEFLSETEKSLQIMLSNHLEDALKKYLR